MASMLAISRLIPISTGPSITHGETRGFGKKVHIQLGHTSSFFWSKLIINCIPTIEIRPEVAVVSLHQLLNCWQKLRVIPFTPVVAGIHATTDNNVGKRNKTGDGKRTIRAGAELKLRHIGNQNTWQYYHSMCS